MTTPLGQITGELQDVREWSGSTAVVSSADKYTGSYSVLLNTNRQPLAIGFPSQETKGLRMGMWGKPVALTGSNLSIFRIHSVNSLLANVYYSDATKAFTLHVGGVLQATVTGSEIGYTPGQWRHYGINYLPDLSLVSFYFDGIKVLSYNGILAGAPTSALFGGIQSGGAGGWNGGYIDDAYVDTDVLADEAPPPDRFLFSLASSAGASAQWTPTGQATNIACVDEAPPNDDTDYIKAQSADLVDLYETTDITLPVDYGIVSVIPIALVKKMAEGPTVKLVASDGVNALLESAEKAPGTSYGYQWETMPLAPDGGAWTEAKVNAAQFGVKSAGVYA